MDEKPVKYIGPGKRKYYLARAEMARTAKVPNLDLARSYEKLAELLPTKAEDDN